MTAPVCLNRSSSLNVARACQERGKNVARARQEHSKSIARAGPLLSRQRLYAVRGCMALSRQGRQRHLDTQECEIENPV